MKIIKDAIYSCREGFNIPFGAGQKAVIVTLFDIAEAIAKGG